MITSRSHQDPLQDLIQDPFQDLPKIPFMFPKASLNKLAPNHKHSIYIPNDFCTKQRTCSYMVFAVTKPYECTQSGTCSIDLNAEPAFVNQLRRATGCSELPSNSVVRQRLHLQNYYLKSKRSRRAPQAASALYCIIEQRRVQQAALAKVQLFVSHVRLVST